MSHKELCTYLKKINQCDVSLNFYSKFKLATKIEKLLSPRICVASVIFDQSESSFSVLWVSWELPIHVILYCVCRTALHFLSQMQSKWLIFMFAIKMILTNIKKQTFLVLTIIDTSCGSSVYAGRLNSTTVLPFISLALISATFCSVSKVGSLLVALQ